MKRWPILLALAAPVPLAAADPAPIPLDSQVRCAALFAIVAGEQDRHLPGAERFPSLDGPGRAFFVATGARLIDAGHVALDDLKPLFVARVQALQAEFAKASDRRTAIDRAMGECLPLLTATPRP